MPFMQLVSDSIIETADRFLVERQTVHDWINRWKEEKAQSPTNIHCIKCFIHKGRKT